MLENPIYTYSVNETIGSAAWAILEITVVSIGWYLGGTVGIGTLLFAFGIGPCVALGLYLVDKMFN